MCSRRLGAGSYGTVSRTINKNSGHLYALKVINKRRSLATSLANEIAIHEACMHPNIVRLYESFEDPCRIHIVLEACEGGEIFHYFQVRGRLLEDEAKTVLQQTLQATFYLHDVKQVAHRDIKPENLLLKFKGTPLKDNIVKLIDFGFAKSFVPGEQSFHDPCGTPTYAAPEMISGSYNEKCDIWSSGILMYELLAGRVPFLASSPMKTLKKAARSSLQLLGPIWVNVSQEAKVLLEDMCQKEATSRLSAAAALQSSWFEEASCTPILKPNIKATRQMGKNIRDFANSSDFQKVALRLAAYRLDDQEVIEQRQMFRCMDKDGNGALSLPEVKQRHVELGFTESEVPVLFEQLDSDNCGSLGYMDFLGAAVSRECLPSAAYQEAFRFFDRDGNGSISADEVKEVTGLPWEDVQEGREMDFAKFVSVLRSPRNGGA